jgi:hypothetical protein
VLETLDALCLESDRKREREEEIRDSTIASKRMKG